MISKSVFSEVFSGTDPLIFLNYNITNQIHIRKLTSEDTCPFERECFELTNSLSRSAFLTISSLLSLLFDIII